MTTILVAMTTVFLLVSCAPSLSGKRPIPPEETYTDEQATKRANDFRGSGPLGSATNPVKCAGEQGIQDYLARLRGPLGQPVTIEKADEGGMSPFGGQMFLYLVRWGENEVQVYLDGDFGSHKESKAASGLKLK